MDSRAHTDDPNAFEAMRKAGKKGSLLGKVNARFQDAIQTGRGDEDERNVPKETASMPNATADDLAMKRAKSVRAQRMVVPEGVIIEGAMSSCSETEISGRVDGDVTVDGQLTMMTSALVSGNIRATSCKVDGLVEGRIDCAQDISLGETGRLSADAVAGKGMVLAGQVLGNVTCGGLMRIEPSARVEGGIRARAIVVEEGAMINGQFSIGGPKKQKASTQ